MDISESLCQLHVLLLLFLLLRPSSSALLLTVGLQHRLHLKDISPHVLNNSQHTDLIFSAPLVTLRALQQQFQSLIY